jgi:hypothetical protein
MNKCAAIVTEHVVKLLPPFDDSCCVEGGCVHGTVQFAEGLEIERICLCS